MTISYEPPEAVMIDGRPVSDGSLDDVLEQVGDDEALFGLVSGGICRGAFYLPDKMSLGVFHLFAHKDPRAVFIGYFAVPKKCLKKCVRA
ncbi:MAG: hypothetical protein AAB471_01800 [Patescibacteria group bacterium]